MEKEQQFYAESFYQNFERIDPQIVEKALERFMDKHPEILERLLNKNNHIFQKVVEKLSYTNIATKDDIKMLHEELKLIVELINKRFEAVDKRFEDINKRFEAVDKRFEAVDKRFEDINKRFEAVDKRFEELREDMNTRFNFLTKLIFAFNVPILVTLIGILFKLFLQ